MLKPLSVSTASPAIASSTAPQVSGADPLLEQGRGEQRGADDVHAGDEPRDAGRRVREPGGLQDLRQAVEQRRGRPPAGGRRRRAGPARAGTCSEQRRRSATANRTARKSSTGTRSSRSLMRKNVEPQQAVTPAARGSPAGRCGARIGGHPTRSTWRGDATSSRSALSSGMSGSPASRNAASTAGSPCAKAQPRGFPLRSATPPRRSGEPRPGCLTSPVTHLHVGADRIAARCIAVDLGGHRQSLPAGFAAARRPV